MSSGNMIPLMVNSAQQNEGAFAGGFQNGTSLQALINQTRLQAQQQQQNQQQLQLGQQQIQQQTIATQEAQQQQQDIQKFNQAFHDANGDWNQTLQNAPGAGVSASYLQQAQMARMDMVTKAAALKKANLDNYVSQQNATAQAYQKTLDADPADAPSVYAKERSNLILNGIVQPGDVPETMPPRDQLQTEALHNKANLDVLTDAQKVQEEQQAEPTKQIENQVKQQQGLGQILGNAQSDVQWQSALKTAKMQGVPQNVLDQFDQTYSPEAATRAKTMSLSPEATAKLPVENLELASYMRQNPGGTPASFMQYKADQTAQAQIRALKMLGGSGPAAPGTPGGQGGPPLTAAQKMGAATGFTPTSLDQAAQSYLTTGTLPPGARGGVAGIMSNRAVMNRAAELDPNASVMGNKQAYQANTDSLKKLQSNFDQVTAFENTAIKNLDQVIAAAKDVPDLGTRFANTPVRLISAQVLGTPQMARLRTALLTAQAESAKVLNSANANGVLSDSARHEAQDILDGNLPFPAMVASANQLKTDFGNRHQAYQDQIADIQGRMRGVASQNGQSGAQGGSGGAQQTTGHKVGDVITQNGRNFKVTAVDANGKVTSAQ